MHSLGHLPSAGLLHGALPALPPLLPLLNSETGLEGDAARSIDFVECLRLGDVPSEETDGGTCEDGRAKRR